MINKSVAPVHPSVGGCANTHSYIHTYIHTYVALSDFFEDFPGMRRWTGGQLCKFYSPHVVQAWTDEGVCSQKRGGRHCCQGMIAIVGVMSACIFLAAPAVVIMIAGAAVVFLT